MVAKISIFVFYSYHFSLSLLALAFGLNEIVGVEAALSRLYIIGVCVAFGQAATKAKSRYGRGGLVFRMQR